MCKALSIENFINKFHKINFMSLILQTIANTLGDITLETSKLSPLFPGTMITLASISFYTRKKIHKKLNKPKK